MKNNLLELITVLSGYTILGLNNWKIAVGVFLIHWSINISKKR